MNWPDESNYDLYGSTGADPSMADDFLRLFTPLHHADLATVLILIDRHL